MFNSKSSFACFLLQGPSQTLRNQAWLARPAPCCIVWHSAHPPSPSCTWEHEDEASSQSSYNRDHFPNVRNEKSQHQSQQKPGHRLQYPSPPLTGAVHLQGLPFVTQPQSFDHSPGLEETTVQNKDTMISSLTWNSLAQEIIPPQF